MPTAQQTARTCSRGHEYYKSSDCPTCPVCEKENKPESGFLALLAAPARRALQQKGIDSLVLLATYTEADILQLHGVGKTTLPVLRKALQEAGLRPDSHRD